MEQYRDTPMDLADASLVLCVVNTPRLTASNRHRRMEVTHPAKLAGQLLCAALSAAHTPTWETPGMQQHTAAVV